MIMKILWFTTKSKLDLPWTTVKNLAKELILRNHEVIIVNSDGHNFHKDKPWSHHQINPKYTFPGVRAASMATAMSKWLASQNSAEYDIAIVDWPLASKLSAGLRKSNLNWVLMDRSPPADAGFLSKLQWIFWRKAWKMVKLDKSRCGFVVSDEHKKFVIDKLQVPSFKIIPIPAGINFHDMPEGEKQSNLHLLYHGNLDKNRNIEAVIEIHKKITSGGIDAILHIYGDGTAFSKLVSIDDERVIVNRSIPQKELFSKIVNYDIGFLPMSKNHKVWRIASPLKKAEYLAAGLVVCGIDHSGHRLKDADEWLKLFSEDDYIHQCSSWINSMDINNLRELQNLAREYAIENMNWTNSGTVLERKLQEIVNQDL